MHRELILHIGGHKTGSSSLQQFLLHNEAALKEAEVTLFRMRPDGKTSTFSNSIYWLEENDQFRHNGMRVIPNFAEALIKTSGRVILATSENFSWVWSKQQLISLHAELAKAFSKISIVAYLKRQDRQALSHHQQGAKKLHSAAAKFYGMASTPLPVLNPYLDNYLDYSCRLGLWGDAFGDENIIIRQVSPKTNTISDFVGLFKLPLTPETLRANTSISAAEFQLRQLAKQSIQKPGRYLHLIPEFNGADKAVPSKADAEKFYGNYAASNRLLNKRFKLNENAEFFDLDFDEYPEHSNLERPEEENEAAITNLLDTVISTHNPNSIFVFAAASDALQVSRPALARRVLRMGLRQFPGAAGLRQRLLALNAEKPAA